MLFWTMLQNTVYCGRAGAELGCGCLEYLFRISISLISIFAYINLLPDRTRLRYAVYHVLVYLENAAMIITWHAFGSTKSRHIWYHIPVMLSVLLGYLIGVAFQALYYVKCHPRKDDEDYHVKQWIACRDLTLLGPPARQTMETVKEEEQNRLEDEIEDDLEREAMLENMQTILRNSQPSLGNVPSIMDASFSGTPHSTARPTPNPYQGMPPIGYGPYLDANYVPPCGPGVNYSPVPLDPNFNPQKNYSPVPVNINPESSYSPVPMNPNFYPRPRYSPMNPNMYPQQNYSPIPLTQNSPVQFINNVPQNISPVQHPQSLPQNIPPVQYPQTRPHSISPAQYPQIHPQNISPVPLPQTVQQPKGANKPIPVKSPPVQQVSETPKKDSSSSVAERQAVPPTGVLAERQSMPPTGRDVEPKDQPTESKPLLKSNEHPLEVAKRGKQSQPTESMSKENTPIPAPSEKPKVAPKPKVGYRRVPKPRRSSSTSSKEGKSRPRPNKSISTEV